MKMILLSILSVLLLLEGCAMFNVLKSIPAPGGCDQCHTVTISTDWHIAYQPAIISDERGRNYFQTPEYNLPEKRKMPSDRNTKTVEELQCFECHRAPDPAHRNRKGRFIH